VRPHPRLYRLRGGTPPGEREGAGTSVKVSAFMPFDNRSARMAPFDWSMIIPEQLSANCRNHVERQAWLDSLSAMLEELTGRWSLRTGPPFEHANVTCSWVAPVVCADGISAVLKLGMPHMEGASTLRGGGAARLGRSRVPVRYPFKTAERPLGSKRPFRVILVDHNPWNRGGGGRGGALVWRRYSHYFLGGGAGRL